MENTDKHIWIVISRKKNNEVIANHFGYMTYSLQMHIIVFKLYRYKVGIPKIMDNRCKYNGSLRQIVFC